MSESIISVAIMLGEHTFVSPVDYKWRHHNLINEMARVGLPIPITGEQGFQTSTGRFVGRMEGLLIALGASQVTEHGHPTELFSEDLW